MVVTFRMFWAHKISRGEINFCYFGMLWATEIIRGESHCCYAQLSQLRDLRDLSLRVCFTSAGSREVHA
jgi:hypothetical protein